MTRQMKRTISIFLLFTIIGTAIVLAQSDSTQGQTKTPTLVKQPELVFPNEAITGRIVGKVWLRILIGPDGIPIKTDIARRDPEMAYLFDDEARKWGMQCRFSPALDSNGRPVALWEVIPLSFKLDHFTPPQCVKQAEPNYPQEALDMGMEGWVGVAVFIKKTGDADGAKILAVAREPENSTVFDIAAKEAASHSQYTAASLDSTSVDGWCFIKVPFKIALQDSTFGQRKQ